MIVRKNSDRDVLTTSVETNNDTQRTYDFNARASKAKKITSEANIYGFEVGDKITSILYRPSADSFDDNKVLGNDPSTWKNLDEKSWYGFRYDTEWIKQNCGLTPVVTLKKGVTYYGNVVGSSNLSISIVMPDITIQDAFAATSNNIQSCNGYTPSEDIAVRFLITGATNHIQKFYGDYGIRMANITEPITFAIYANSWFCTINNDGIITQVQKSTEEFAVEQKPLQSEADIIRLVQNLTPSYWLTWEEREDGKNGEDVREGENKKEYFLKWDQPSDTIINWINTHREEKYHLSLQAVQGPHADLKSKPVKWNGNKLNPDFQRTGPRHQYTRYSRMVTNVSYSGCHRKDPYRILSKFDVGDMKGNFNFQMIHSKDKKLETRFPIRSVPYNYNESRQMPLSYLRGLCLLSASFNSPYNQIYFVWKLSKKNKVIALSRTGPVIQLDRRACYWTTEGKVGNTRSFGRITEAAWGPPSSEKAVQDSSSENPRYYKAESIFKDLKIVTLGNKIDITWPKKMPSSFVRHCVKNGDGEYILEIAEPYDYYGADSTPTYWITYNGYTMVYKIPTKK